MVTPALLSALKEEMAGLERELHATIQYQRIAAIKAVVQLYGATTGKAEPVDHIACHSSRPARQTTRDMTPTSSSVALAEAFLRKIGRRAQTHEILEAIKQAGVTFVSQNPVGSLSSALSHHPNFNNVRGFGYGLAEWGQEISAPKNADDPGTALFGSPGEAPASSDANPRTDTLDGWPGK